MKKRTKAAICVTIAIILVSSIAILKFTGSIEINAFNKASKLDFKLCEDFNTSGERGYVVSADGHAFGYTWYEKYSESGDFSGGIKVMSYPDTVIGKGRVTTIAVADNDKGATMLGVKCGDPVETAVRAFKRYGYKISSAGLATIGKKGKITVKFTNNDGVITKMSVSVENTNIFKIKY